MVRRVLAAMYKEIRSLHQAAYVLALFAFGSQLLALVRDRLLAGEFGAGIELDLYYAAFRVPDLLYVLFASMLSVYVLIPFVAERLERGGTESARELLSTVFTLFLAFYVLLAAALFVLAPLLVSVLFPGFVGAESETLVHLLRIMLLQPFFLGVSSLFGVITQLGHRFVLYALSPILYNVGIIVGIVVFYPFVGLVGLAYGVVLGATLHMAVQVPFIKGSRLVPTLVQIKDTAPLWRIFRVSVPRALTLSLHQVLFLVLLGIASVMAAGSVSVFQFAYNLQSVPLSVIGVSYSVAAFPTLARLFSRGAREKFKEHVMTALRHILFWSVPAVALIVVERAHIVRVILGTGSFDWADTRLTAAALALFVVSIVAQAVNLIILRAFYACGNTRTPLLVTIFSSLGTLALSTLLFIWFKSSNAFALGLEALMRVEGVPGSEVLTLPLGYTIGLIIHTSVLLLIFSHRYRMSLAVFGSALGRSVAAGAFAGFGTYGALNLLVYGVKTNTFLGILLQGTLAGVVGVIGAGCVLYLLKSPELAEVLRAFHKKIFKTDVIAPEDGTTLAT